MGVNHNCFSLMNAACGKLKGNFWRAFLATFIVVAPLVAVAFIPYYVGIVISIFFSGYLFLGLIEYYKKLFKGETPSLKVIFKTDFRKFGASILIGAINVASLLLGLILFIVPCVLYIMYYGVNLHILSDEEETRFTVAFKENSRRMYTNKTLVLSYKVLCYFLMILIFAVCGLCFVPICGMYETNFALCITLGVLDVLFGIVLLTFVQVLYQATQMEFYLTCLPSLEQAEAYHRERNERAVAKKHKEAKITETKTVEPETKEEEKVEEVKTEASEVEEVKKTSKTKKK